MKKIFQILIRTNEDAVFYAILIVWLICGLIVWKAGIQVNNLMFNLFWCWLMTLILIGKRIYKPFHNWLRKRIN